MGNKEDIFLGNSRVEQLNGMKFYEQDVVMLDYIYTGDTYIDLDVEYNYPGIGIVYSMQREGLKLSEEAQRSLLVKVGTLDFSVYRKNFGTQFRAYNASCYLTPDKNVHTLRFKRIGSYVYLYEIINDKEIEIGYYNTKQTYGKYYIGIYSNKENVIKNMRIYNNRPRYWFTNIKNTNGGRISFEENTLNVEQAEKDAEIEQQNIKLKKGTYYLSYEYSPIDDVFDARTYLFDSSAPEIKAPDKTILKKDKDGNTYFSISDDTEVSLLFQIKSGKIYNIAIKDDKNQDFVPTDDTSKESPGSYILLKLENLKKIEWTGVVNKIPVTDLMHKKLYSLFSYNGDATILEDGNVSLSVPYDYSFNNTGNNSWAFTIKNKEKSTVCSKQYASDNKRARIFDGVSGYISSIVITLDDGSTIDILNQRTIRKYVPATIDGPILVTDENDVPFDLSASYRILPDGKYVFTNWEREIFDAASNNILLASELNNDMDIYLYGVREDIPLNKLYKADDEGRVFGLSAAAERFDRISGDLYRIVENQNLILNYTVMQNNYKYFIVDYLKNNSYCINMNADSTEYIVDISTRSSKANTSYDMTESGTIRTYKSIDKFNPMNNSYVVLRKEED